MEAPDVGRPEAEIKTDNILILDRENKEVASVILGIIDELPHVSITRVDSVQTYKDIVKSQDFDVVVMDYDVSGPTGIELIHELKLKDYEPSVLIVSTSVESKILTDIYNYGNHRYIVKRGGWKEEVGPAVRHLLRIRRLENENRNLLAKLTEANYLLNEKNKRLDEFSATLAHDIRGPLGGICMKIEYILDKYGANFDDKLRGLLDRAHSSSERLTRVVQAMYDFAKLGLKAAKMNEVDLAVLVPEVIADLSFDDALNITIGLGELPKVWGNAELLRRVFFNLIANAVKYNDKDEIVVNVGLRKREHRTLGEFCEIIVSDNGPGIAHDYQKEIFQLFGRGAAAGGSKEGLGLGLSEVRRIVELHFGKVWVESEVGRGTTMVLFLPVDEISFS